MIIRYTNVKRAMLNLKEWKECAIILRRITDTEKKVMSHLLRY